VPAGSWLIVESLDRISRQVARKAVRTIEDIVEAGITVVDLSDGGREYSTATLDSDGMLFMMMVLRFIRSNEESTLKGARVASAYAQKRKTFASDKALDKPYTRRLPAWIRWDDEAKAYALIEDRADLLRRMFQLTDEGWGQHRIAAWLNETGVETWGAGGWKAKYWHRSYVRKLLSNKAAIGTFIPHRVPKVTAGTKRVRTPLDAILNRFPAAIEKELFERVASRLSTTAARGKNTAAAPRSIFAGIMKCRHCMGTVTRVTKGDHVYLVCSAANAKARTCRYESVPYQQAENALRWNIEHTVEQAPRGKDAAEIQKAIEQHEVKLDAGDDEMRELLRVVITDKSRAARERLRDTERERDRIRESLRSLRERRDALTSTNVTARLNAVFDACKPPENDGIDLSDAPLDIVKANKALKAAVRMMVMKPEEGTLDIYWHHADEPQEITFVTRRKRWESPLDAEMMNTVKAEG
jgi:hypothetical protein